MVYSSRVLALLLAFCISLITTLFLSLFEDITAYALLVSGFISFSVSYLLTFVVMEFLVFREINKIYKMMEKLKKKELGGIGKQKSGTLNPLRSINDEIFSFAELKQKEIDELKKSKPFGKNLLRMSRMS